ncbi:MAG: preprotein translocase subunit SecG [Lautropia sp.]
MSNLIHTIAVVVQVLSALGVILLVLIQHGKGADMGAAFGSGASGSLFGATGSANFLSRLTAALAATFFISTLGLAFIANDRPRAPGSLMEGAVPQGPASTIPATVPPPAAPRDVPTVGGQGAGAPASGGAGAASVPSVPSAPSAPSAPASGAADVPPAPAAASPAGADSGASPQPPAASGANSSSSTPEPKQEGANSK